MTRKHFEAIAKVIQAIDCKATRHEVALNMVTMLGQFNPRLDVHRFVQACIASDPE